MLPYNQNDIFHDFRYLKQIRLLRSLTLKDMESLMKVDQSTLSKLERGELKFSQKYSSYFEIAVKKLRLSNGEIASLRKVIELREARKNNFTNKKRKGDFNNDKL